MNDTYKPSQKRIKQIEMAAQTFLWKEKVEELKTAKRAELQHQEFTQIINILENDVRGDEDADDLRLKAGRQAKFFDRLFHHYIKRSREISEHDQYVDRALKMQLHATRAMDSWCRIDARMLAAQKIKEKKRAERTEQKSTKGIDNSLSLQGEGRGEGPL